MNKFRNQSRGFDRKRGGSSGMHEAVCGECGKRCQVPFRPTGQKPVYCSECFGGQKDFRGPSRSQERSAIVKCDCREQLEKIILKLDDIINLITPAPKEPAKKKTLKEVVKSATKKKAVSKKK